MSYQGMTGGHARFEAYIPVLCAPADAGRPSTKGVAGKTQSVGAGGLRLLLPEALPREMPVSVRLWQGDPYRGHIVWVGPDDHTDARPTVPHGMAFDHPVDTSIVREWLSQAKRHPQARVPVRFAVEYRETGKVGQGICLNLSRGGMFIATAHPTLPGTELTLRFSLPDLSDPVSILARVVWKREEDVTPDVVSGMGVQFLRPRPVDTALIGDLVDRLREENPRFELSFLASSS